MDIDMENNKIEELTEFLLDYNKQMENANPFVFDNLSFFYEMVKKIKEIPLDFEENWFEHLTDFSMSETIQIVKNYYKKYNKNFYEEFKNSIFSTNFYFEWKEDLEEDPLPFGIEGSFYEQELGVETYFSGKTTDILVLVHEYRHMKNDETIGRNMIGDFLTESVSLTEELRMIDYLVEEKYISQKEAHLLKRMEFCSNQKLSFYFDLLYEPVMLCKCFGKIDQEGYQLLFQNEEYDEFLRKLFALYDYICEYGDLELLITACEYLFALLFASYSRQKMKENEKFHEQFEILNQQIKTCNDIQVLRIMEIDHLSLQDIETMVDCLAKEAEECIDDYVFVKK